MPNHRGLARRRLLRVRPDDLEVRARTERHERVPRSSSGMLTAGVRAATPSNADMRRRRHQVGHGVDQMVERRSAPIMLFRTTHVVMHR